MQNLKNGLFLKTTENLVTLKWTSKIMQLIGLRVLV